MSEWISAICALPMFCA